MDSQKFTINQLLSLFNVFNIVLKSNKGFVSWFISNILSILLVIPFFIPVLFFFFGINIPQELFMLSKALGYILSPLLAYHVYYAFKKILNDYLIHFLSPYHNYLNVAMSSILTILVVKTLIYSWTFY